MKPTLLAAALFFVPPCFAQSTSFTISPETIVDCQNGYGQATLTWSYTAPVKIRVNSVSGTPLTGPEPPSGTAETAYWVVDGMVFVLVDEANNEVARVAAKVNCGGSPNSVEAALRSGSYFPLAIGNQWVFRVNNRQVTSTYETWQVMRTDLVNGRTYFVLNTGAYFRNDSAGRIYMLQGGATGSEVLWLDPTTPPDPSASLRIQDRAAASTSVGSFDDAIYYQTLISGLILENGVLARGVGLVSSNSAMLSGSSGGFYLSRELLFARIDGNLRFAAFTTGLQLSAEKTVLDVSGKTVTNCAVPCYFAACGLVPGADPPGTYKPCFQARVAAQRNPGDTGPAAVDLDFLDRSGGSLYHTSVPVAAAANLSDSAFLEAVFFLQVPLYSSPNNPFPPGAYRLVTHTKSATGEETGSATLAIIVK